MFDAIPLLGEKSRAWLGSVKGMPPNQVAMAATRAAQSGLMPFGDALAIKQMADRITKSGSMQGPPPGNVMGDLQMKIRSALTGQPMMPPQGAMPPGAPPPGAMPPGAPPPGAMPPGAPPPGAMPPPPPPAMMNAGLATLPAPALEGPPPGAPGMAAGGIVAFQEGGLNNPYMQEVEPDYDAYGVRVPGEEEPAPEMSLADILGGAGAEGFSSEVDLSNPDFSAFLTRRRADLEKELEGKKKTREEYMAEAQARREKSGYGQALKDRAAAIEGRGSKLEEELAKKTKLGKAAAGFKMAQAASQPGATFLGSLAEGLAGYAQTKGDLEDRALAAREAMEDRKFALAQAMEEAKARGDAEGLAAYADDMARIRDSEKGLDALMGAGADLAMKEKEIQSRMAIAGQRATGMRPPTTELERLNRAHTDALEEVNNTRPGTKERAAAEAKLASIKEAAQYVRESQAGYQTGMKGIEARISIAAADSIEKNKFLIGSALAGNVNAQKRIAAIAKQFNMTYEEYVGAATKAQTEENDPFGIR